VNNATRLKARRLIRIDYEMRGSTPRPAAQSSMADKLIGQPKKTVLKEDSAKGWQPVLKTGLCESIRVRVLYLPQSDVCNVIKFTSSL
jgi:hypothetical protein